jgi:hypothetical protein
MIQEIRTYFKERIIEVDPDLIELESDVFGNNDEDQARVDKYYNLVLGRIASTRNGNSHSDTMEVALDIYGNAKRNIYASYAELYEKAWEVKKQLICPLHLYQTNIADLEAVDMQPIEMNDNDKVIKIRLTFNLRVDYGF